jgi:hypothetical protein
MGERLRNKFLRIAFIAGIIVTTLMALTGCERSLISDQEMIDHFNAHKQEFNELVQSFRDHGAKSLEWSQRPEVVDLKAKIGVSRILVSTGCWFDDPYSPESAEKLRQMRVEKSWDQNHSCRSAIIKMSARNVHEALYLSTGFNWKDYFYFPVDPHIEQGKIKLPRKWYDSGVSDLWLRVLDSTDSLYWWNWERGECVLTKIEPKWYIRRCRAG